MKNKKAFTLVELLVVISIITLLMAILMPALQRARGQAMTMVCRVNIKNLSIGWFTYQSDNRDKLIGADALRCRNSSGLWGWIDESAFHPNNGIVDLDSQFDAIKAGRLYEYCKDMKAYHCPSDKRYLSPPPRRDYFNGKVGGYVSYQIQTLMAGQDIEFQMMFNKKAVPVLKYAEIRSPSTKMVFLDVRDNRGANLGSWMLGSLKWNQKSYSWESPFADSHSGGENLGFADGHSEFYKWKDRRTAKFQGSWAPTTESPIYQPGNKDWDYMYMAFLPKNY